MPLDHTMAKAKHRKQSIVAANGGTATGVTLRTKSGARYNLFTAFRNIILRRRKKPVRGPQKPSLRSARSVRSDRERRSVISAPLSASSATASSHLHGGQESNRPAPPPSDREPSGNDDDDAEGDDEEGDEEAEMETDGVADGGKKKQQKKKQKKKKQGWLQSRTTNKWVASLLNQGGGKKDRVHRKKKRRQPVVAPTDSLHAHPFVATLEPNHVFLLGRVLTFLGSHDDHFSRPAAAATVNRVFAAASRLYYEELCAHPRPQPYLSYKVLTDPQSPFPTKILQWLDVEERVRCSACNRSLYDASNRSPLVISGNAHAEGFLRHLTPERINSRYSKMEILQLQNVNSDLVAQTMLLMDTSDDDEMECFGCIHTIEISGFRKPPAQQHLVQMLQVLFTDRISRQLQRLVLSDLCLEDAHFKRLSQLLYDGRFPRLYDLDLSKNAFSSRFMRDWSRAFREDRFQALQSLNVSYTAMGLKDLERFFTCLEHVPNLQRLDFSGQFCSLEVLEVLAAQVRRGKATRMSELRFASSSVTSAGMMRLLETCRPHTLSQLTVLDVSGNAMADVRTCYQFAQMLATGCCTQLQHLNLSRTHLQGEGLRTIAQSFGHRSCTRLKSLDLSGNPAVEGFEAFVDALTHRAFPVLKCLRLADMGLGGLEFENLGHALSGRCCPHLETLDLAGIASIAALVWEVQHTQTYVAQHNQEMLLEPKGSFVLRPGERIHVLDLSQNDISPRGLTVISETLRKAHCLNLQELNLSRNHVVPSVVHFQETIRLFVCPSLSSLQLAYAQTYEEGRAFIRDVLSRISVEELRRRKQILFEKRIRDFQERSQIKVVRANQRCKDKCRLLREMYDHMENEAARALRRRKLIRKSTHLMIHQEIERLKQEKYHNKLRQQISHGRAD
ncbi:TPA: hypothetical protein N0F65_006505 [Lagenidium giganteum]|uniref:Uncharacterized protein n=1 Tax=Lagenidium giganteum TaxID=4803 RepID=A0AAV2YSW3_9STRA|nr:TPA: hypothetical protein N0F65_006505 [Lagenidium giganteum]